MQRGQDRCRSLADNFEVNSDLLRELQLLDKLLTRDAETIVVKNFSIQYRTDILGTQQILRAL